MSVADIFYKHGIRLYKTSRDRIDGWAAMKEWMKPFVDEVGVKVAKLRIHESCVNLIRCIPALQYDPNRPSDVATKPHEITHAPDAIRGFCVYRSRANREPARMSESAYRTERELREFNSNDMFDVYGQEEKSRYDDSSNSLVSDMYGQ